jgi:hypothetical protein
VLCTSCGGKLKEAQKFCGGCGSKVQATVPKPGAGSDPVVMIAPLKLELPTMPIEIGSVKIEGPDGDGSFSMIASCKFTNNSKEDWDFLEIRAHLINSDGIVLQESTDTPEELIEASGLYEHEVRFWNVPAAHLGEAEKATVVLSAIASKKHSHEFQDVPIPSTANEINDLAPPCLVGSSLYFTSGSIWKTKPDDDKESRVELNLLLQNTSNTALSKVRLTAEILDKQGKSLTDIGSDKEMRSGELMMLSSGYSNVKDKKLHGAKVKLSVQSYCPAAAAVVQKTGAEVVAADSDSGWGSSSGDEESDVNSDEHDEVARSGSTMSFEWRMDNGEINMNDVEDDDVRAALKSALKLAKAKKFEEAVRALPSMDFEYNFSNLDSDASEYFAETDGISFQLDPSDPKHIIQVGVSGNKLNLSVTVLFDVPVKAGLNADELNGWLGDNGGYAAGFATGGWSYNGDEGGHMLSIEYVSEISSQLDPVENITCRYCVDLGRYIFQTKFARDKFLKKPEFIFDFQPGNIDDKEGLIKIFGSDNFKPTFENTPPKFSVTHLEKDDNNTLGIIISVEIEMSFALKVEIDEFRNWIESNQSTWRYSGRIECVGEEGLETSDREEYEFDW